MNRVFNVTENDYAIENGKVVFTSEELLQAINDTEFNADAEEEDAAFGKGISINFKCTVNAAD